MISHFPRAILQFFIVSNKFSRPQAVLGTVISAVTGSDNPQEVAEMAKQATEVRELKLNA